MKSLSKYISTLFVTFFMLSSALVIFLLYSPKALDWTAKELSSHYHLSYKTLSGSLFDGVRIEALAFRDKTIVDRLAVRWDLLALFSNEISFQTLTVDGLHLDSSMDFVDFFRDDEEDNGTFPFHIAVKDLRLHVHAFDQYGIAFENIRAAGKGLLFYGDGINVDDLELEVDSKVSTSNVHLNIHNKKVEVSTLRVLNIDAFALQAAIEKMIAVNLPQTIQEEIEPEIEKQRAGLKNYLPRSIEVQSALFTLKASLYPLIDIKKSELKLHTFFMDIYKLIDGDMKTVQVSDFNFFVDSNLSSFTQKGFIKNSRLHASGAFTFPHALLESYGIALSKNAVEDVNVKFDAGMEEVLATVELEAHDLLGSDQKDLNISQLTLKSNLRYIPAEKSLQVQSKANIASTYTKNLLIDNNLTLIQGKLLYSGDIDIGELQGMDVNDSRLLHGLTCNYRGEGKKIDLSMDTALAKIDATIQYEGFLKVNSKTIFPKKSLLRERYSQINFDALSPLKTDLILKNNMLKGTLFSEQLQSNFSYNTSTSDLKAELQLGSSKFTASGNTNRKFTVSTTTHSIQKLFMDVSKLFAFNPPPLDGDATLSLVLEAMQHPILTVDSKNLTLPEDKKKSLLQNTHFTLGYENDIVTLYKYRTLFEQQTFFSNKPSKIMMKDNRVEFPSFWVNDTLKIKGKYDLEDQKGELTAFAERLNVSYEKNALQSAVNVTSKIKEQHASVKGVVTILGGNIYYDVDTKQFDTDSDIVMRKTQKKVQKNIYYDLLETDLKVSTQKPLVYKNKKANMQVTVDLTLTKSVKGPLQIVGDLHILSGSTYTFKGHTLVLKKSSIHFTGDPKQPSLDLSAHYRAPRADINIQITGSPASPHYILSSRPYMNKQEILSMFLFDSLEEGDNHSEEELTRLMGDSMKNSKFSNVGDTVATSIFSSIGMNIANLPFIGSSHHARHNEKILTSLLSFETTDKVERVPIHFHGQKHFEEKKLQKVMGVETGERYKFWEKTEPSIKESLLPALETSLRSFYNAEGYYDAQISVKQSKKEVNVTIHANTPVKIKKIHIQSDFNIKDIISFKTDKRFTSKEFVDVKTSIINTMMREGYCHYTLDTKAYIDRKKHSADIAVKLQKGPLCTFGEIKVKGLTNIKDDVVFSRVRAKEGERFNSEKITKSYDALYALDAFDSIYIDPAYNQNNVVPLDISASEVTQPWYVKGGIGWEGDTGLRLTSEVIRTNLFGDARQLSLELVYSSIDKLARFNYVAPARFTFLGYYLDLTTEVAYNRFNYSDFSEDKLYARSYVSYNGEHMKLHAGLALENIEISPFSVGKNNIQLGDENYQLIYPRLEFSYDQRDSAHDPKNGYYFSGSIEYALPYKKESASFIKYELEARGILTFFESLTLSAVGKIGAISHIENAIPASKLFFAGGMASNRAYGYQRMGVTLSPTSFGKLGGSSMTNLSLEANYPLTEELDAAIFSDNTALNIESFDLTGEVISSAGIGLRYLTPIGPVKIDYGMNINDHSQSTLHFQLGQSF